jgi:hypothetical protein
MEYSSKIDLFINFSNKYVDVIEKLLDFSVSKKILPLKILLGLNILKKYIRDNKVNLIQNGVEYLLNYKDTILNFDLHNLDELDNDSEDNVSRKSCLNNITKAKQIINEQNYKENEILDLIIEIKNNAKILNISDKSIIKGYMEVLIMILEKIKDLFI